MSPVHIDPRMQEILDVFQSGGPLPIERLSPEAARQLPTLADAAKEVMSRHVFARAIKPGVEPVAHISHRSITTKDGQMLVRIYRPEGEGLLPVVIYFHGGGWVLANLDTYDSSCRALANSSEAIVVSVAYRQAPEHKFPAAPEDAFAAYEWALSEASSFCGDATRISVAGESAGGNLAAVVCLMAKRRGLPVPRHQLLIYPVMNYGFDTPTYREFNDAKPLNREMMFWFWGHYLEREEDADDYRASPLRAPDLTALPAATIILAEVDPLRSEGEAYARRLQEAGISVEVRGYEGVTHEFFGMSGLLSQARDAIAFAGERLRAATSTAAYGAPDESSRQTT